MRTFFNWNGFLSFMNRGPAYKQKYKYVPRIVNSGPGVLDRNHDFVLRSGRERDREENRKFYFDNFFALNSAFSWSRRNFVISFIDDRLVLSLNNRLDDD